MLFVGLARHLICKWITVGSLTLVSVDLLRWAGSVDSVALIFGDGKFKRDLTLASLVQWIKHQPKD